MVPTNGTSPFHVNRYASNHPWRRQPPSLQRPVPGWLVGGRARGEFLTDAATGSSQPATTTTTTTHHPLCRTVGTGRLGADRGAGAGGWFRGTGTMRRDERRAEEFCGVC